MADCTTSEAVVINIEAGLTVQEENQGRVSGTYNSNPVICIYKVPHNLIGISPKAIDPEKVSIGPYHRGKHQLSDFESYKWRSLRNLLTRTHKQPKVFVEAATQLELRARACYDDTVNNMSSPDFVQMMVLDGCFIIELFRPGGTNDPIFSRPAGLIPAITGDLLKLENQLPFFVLQELFDLSLNQREEGIESSERNLPWLALKFFHGSFPRPTDQEVIDRPSSEFSDVKHLLHLFHSSCCRAAEERMREQLTIFQLFWREVRRNPILIFAGFTGIVIAISLGVLAVIIRLLQPYRSQEYRPSSDSIPCRTNLRKSGATFKPLRAESLLVIKYENQVLHIPAITISDLTVTVFVNCIALEQSSYKNTTDSYFTTYIAFMSCLINSSKDVALLSKDGIIESSFSYNDHEVASLFKRLGEKVNFHKKDCYLYQQFKDIGKYYKVDPMARFRSKFFSHPWSVFSFFSACILLSLSVGQTVLSILTYKNNLKIWSEN